MRSFTGSALLALALGVLTLQPSYAQDQNQTRDRQRQDQRQDTQARQRDRDQRQSQAERRERQERRQQEMRNRQRRDDDRQRAQRGRDQQSRQQMGQQSRRGRVTGEVIKTKRVDVRGTDQQRLVALLKTDNRKRVPVDLGNPNQLGRQQPTVGDQITVRGRLVRIGDRAVIVGEEMEADRRIVRIDQTDARDNRNRNRGRNQQARNQQAGNQQARNQQANQERQGSRGGLGVSLASDDSVDGVRVNNVMRNSPADRAGIRPGDVIASINNQDVSSPRELFRAVVQRRPGQEVNLTIRRNGQRLRVTPELTSRQDALNLQSQRDRNQR